MSTRWGQHRPGGAAAGQPARPRKREHSRKPDELYDLIEAYSPGPRLELFARGSRPGWTTWGDQAVDYAIGWETYAHNSGGAGVWAEAAE